MGDSHSYTSPSMWDQLKDVYNQITQHQVSQDRAPVTPLASGNADQKSEGVGGAAARKRMDQAIADNGG